MTQAIAPKTLLYERDLNLWIATPIYPDPCFGLHWSKAKTL